jgi:hypothetical protein
MKIEVGDFFYNSEKGRFMRVVALEKGEPPAKWSSVHVNVLYPSDDRFQIGVWTEYEDAVEFEEKCKKLYKRVTDNPTIAKLLMLDL